MNKHEKYLLEKKSEFKLLNQIEDISTLLKKLSSKISSTLGRNKEKLQSELRIIKKEFLLLEKEIEKL